MRTDVVIVGAGQAGLAVSQRLSAAGVDHLVLERGRVAERWSSQPFASLRLLTPNWMTRLPGWRYAGPDPDGFMTRREVVDFLQRYAASFRAPVMEQTTVIAAERAGDGYRVRTDRGDIACRSIVVATGHCDRPRIPALAQAAAADIYHLHSSRYRAPDALPDGGVLVVGGSSSGVQIADELARAGRDVVLSTGRHIRMPRTWRGRDVFWWMDRAGILEQHVEDLPDPAAAARQPSMQLVGRPDRSDINLERLARNGVRIAGRLGAVFADRLAFHDDLAASAADADRRLAGLLARFDAIDPAGPRGVEAPAPLAIGPGLRELSTRDAGIRSIVWATGFRRVFDWLKLPVVGADGELVHHLGVTPAPGVYAIGYRLLSRRNSNFIDGVGTDAARLAIAICNHLSVPHRRAA